MAKRIRVLIVEDSPSDAELMARALAAHGFSLQSQRVATQADYLAALDSVPDVILADYRLPEFSGPQALRLLAERQLDVPFIVVSGTISDIQAANLIKAGASDFLLKDRMARLGHAVEQALERKAARDEQRRLESALRESEEKHRLICETTTDAVILLDAKNRIRYANPAVSTVFGYAPKELVGADIGMLQPERFRSQHAEAVGRFVETGVATRGWGSVERVGLHRDGREFPVEIAYSHMTLEGEPIFVGFIRDITGREKAQKALREREAGLRQAQLMAKLAHVVTGPDGEFENWSETLPQLIGVEPAAMPRSTRECLDLLHPEDRATYRAKSIEAGIKGTRTEVEYRLPRADGTWVQIRHVLEPLPGEPDALGRWRWFNTLQDVTEQKRAESALKESEAKFRDLIEQASDGIFLCDADGRYVLANSRFCEMLDYGREELIGLHFSRTYPEEEKTLAAERSAQVRKIGSGLFERRMRRKDGSLFPAEMSLRLLRDGTIQGIARDISGRKREERLRSLEHAVARCLASADDASTGLKALMRAVCESEGWALGTYWRVDDAAGVLRLGEVWSVQGAELEQYTQASREVTFGPGVGLVGRVWKAGEPLWSVDFRSDPRVVQQALARATGLRGMFAFPVVSEGRTIGVLAFFSLEIRDPDERLLAATRVIGSQVGQFLQRKQGEQKIRRLNRVYAVLSSINAAIIRVRERDELFREVCRIAFEQGGFAVAWAGVIDRKTMEVIPVAWQGVDETYVRSIRRSVAEGDPAGEGVVGTAMRSKHAVVSNDIEHDARLALRTMAFERGSRALAVLPLMVAGETAGVLVLHAREAGFFDEREMKLLLELAGDISFALEHIEKSERLDYLAYYDPVTGLANRSLFLERISREVQAATRDRRSLAIVMFDVEGLDAVNDAFGRSAGDELLKQVAQRMLRFKGEPEWYARIGSNRFGIMDPEAKGEDEIGRRAEAGLQNTFGAPFRLGDTELRLSGRVGIAMFPSDSADAETLYKNAEAALKNAKASGERYLFYTHRMSERVAERLALENKLRHALEREEFVLHFQPKVDLETGRMTGVEALIRWQSPESGLVPPARFIPLMEETGLILEVGNWAMQRAVLHHRDWMQQGIDAPRIAVNVSPVQLRRRDFAMLVEEAIRQGVKPPGLDLEITESIIMADIEGNIEKLNAVGDLGVNVAIDDFGTGYSSLGYLARLPVQAVKIDRSFIVKMVDDPDAMTLVSTIISLAHSLRLKVIAEGVESEEQAKFLRLLRCDEMQGYLFSRPLPFDEITAFLGRKK